MKKTKRWRSIRLQRKREKQRLHKQAKPERDPSFSMEDMATDKPGFNIFAFLSRKVPKEERIDRRGNHNDRKRGDR